MKNKSEEEIAKEIQIEMDLEHDVVSQGNKLIEEVENYPGIKEAYLKAIDTYYLIKPENRRKIKAFIDDPKTKEVCKKLQWVKAIVDLFKDALKRTENTNNDQA